MTANERLTKCVGIYVVIMDDFKQLRDLVREEIGDLKVCAKLSEQLTDMIEQLPETANSDELHEPLQDLLDVDYQVRQAIKELRSEVEEKLEKN